MSLRRVNETIDCVEQRLSQVEATKVRIEGDLRKLEARRDECAADVHTVLNFSQTSDRDTAELLHDAPSTPFDEMDEIAR